MDGRETLYTLSDALGNAIEGAYTVEEETGEVLWAPDDLDALGMRVADKAEAVLAVGRNYAALAEQARAESKRLAELAKVYAAHETRLREYMAECVKAAGKPIETRLGRLSLRKSVAVEILDEGAVPQMFMVPQPPKPAKNAIRTALRNGKEVPGAALVTNETLQVR